MTTSANLSIIFESINSPNGVPFLLDYENSTDQYPSTNGSGPGGRNRGLRPRPPGRRLSPTDEAINALSYYTCPAILAIGVVSNVLAYLVFTRTRLRKVPSVPYLSAMAVVDSGALITEFITTVLRRHDIHFITMPGVCQYVTYLNYVFLFLCIWYPVALCLEKFIAVYFPLRKAALCTPFKAKVIVIAMAVMTCVCYYYIIYMTGVVNLNNFIFCGTWLEFQEEFQLLMKLDFVFVKMVPCILLVVLIALILARGCEYYRNNSTSVEVNNRASTSRNGSSKTSPLLITNVVFFVVFFMLLLKLPMSVVRFFGFVNSRAVMRSKLTMDLQPIFLYMNRLDWAIKLYVYLIFSPPFRKSFRSFLRSIFAKMFERWGHGSSESEEGRIVPPRIILTDRVDPGQETRACLMTSADV